MEQQEAIGYLLQHIGPMMSRQIDQNMQEQVGIGYSQFKLLHMLQVTPEIKQHTMAAQLGQTEASVSRQIKLLADKGLLISRINPKSRREHMHALTPKGIKMTRAVDVTMYQYLEPLFEAVSDKQQKQLLETLATLHALICREGRLTACNHPFNV